MDSIRVSYSGCTQINHRWHTGYTE